MLFSAAFGIGDRTLERLRELRPLGLTPASFVSHDAQTHMDPYASLICAAQEGNLVIYDTETTGLDVLRDDIIQLSAIRMNAEGEILDTFDELLIPTVPMSSGALMTHHKTMDEILAGGLEAREGLRRFSAFVDGCVLVGHNSLRFDRPLVRNQMRKRGLPLPSDAGEYDTMLIAKQFLPALRNYRLETLCREFGIVNEHAHDALGDITATGRVLVRLLHDFILPATEARRNAVAAYAPKFAALYAFLNELDGNYLRVGDIQGLLHAVMDVLHLPSRCVRDSDRDAIRDLTDYFSPYDGSRPELDAEGELRDFLANLALSGSQMDVLIHKLHKIPIITVHQAKGCEFDTVIIVDADEGSYPSGRSRTPEEEAEEQRIFYVAISRAREQLILISTQDRYGSYHMSPYIDRIPSSCIARWEWPGHERVD